MDPYETKVIDTDVGPYTVELHYDEHGGMGDPLVEYDHEGMSVYLYYRESNGWQVAYDNLSDGGRAGEILADLIYSHGGYGDNDDVIRRFRKWQAISGDKTALVDDYLNRYSGSMHYLVLVDGSWGDDPEKYAASVMEEWRQWADGEVYGYIVRDPAGKNIDSCWGFIGMDSADGYMLEQAVDAVRYDARQRIEKTNLVGAGFVGLV